MSLPVYFHAGVAGLGRHDPVELTGDEGHHAVVKRVRAGESAQLTDGSGTIVTVTVTEVTRTGFQAIVEAVTTTPRETPRVVVVQAIPKGDRGELAVEMLTEVGVDVVVPWAASRCVAIWRGDKADKALAKWRSSAREAAKQARRAWFPEVRPMVTTDEVARLLRETNVPVVLHEAASGPLADVPVPGRGEIVIVVGPEGGLDESELAAFAAAGAEPVRLGSSVLRTSTAGVAATAALLTRSPRWR